MPPPATYKENNMAKKTNAMKRKVKAQKNLAKAKLQFARIKKQARIQLVRHARALRLAARRYRVALKTA
jgi:hypothetical protein